MEYPDNQLRKKINIVNEKAPTSAPKPPKKEIPKVVKGAAVLHKPTVVDKARGSILGGEIKTASMYVLTDVLVPAIRNIIVDVTSKGIERLVYGESSPRKRMTNYGGVFQAQPSQRLNQPVRPPSTRPPVGASSQRTDVLVEDREEAELVLQNLYEALAAYDVVSVSDLKTLVGLPQTYVDDKWGWSSLKGSTIRHTRGGWLIELPQPEPI